MQSTKGMHTYCTLGRLMCVFLMFITLLTHRNPLITQPALCTCVDVCDVSQIQDVTCLVQRRETLQACVTVCLPYTHTAHCYSFPSNFRQENTKEIHIKADTQVDLTKLIQQEALFFLTTSLIQPLVQSLYTNLRLVICI